MRYYVTDPVDGGYAWFNVCDNQADMAVRTIATFYKNMPMARSEAYALAIRLNENQ